MYLLIVVYILLIVIENINVTIKELMVSLKIIQFSKWKNIFSLYNLKKSSMRMCSHVFVNVYNFCASVCIYDNNS